MPHRSNWEGNVTYMGEEESNGSFLDTWARFPNIYDIYDTNDEDAMTYFRPEGCNLTILTCQVEIWHPRGFSCDLGKLSGFPLELREDGRLGKGEHVANLEHTP